MAHRPRPDRRNTYQPRFSERRGERADPAWLVPKPMFPGVKSKPPIPERFMGGGEASLAGLGNPELPIAAHREELLDNIRNNQVTILTGETGSGKTTQSWQYLLGEGYDVIVLLPRRLIVDNLYERAIDELGKQRSPELAQELLGMVHSERNQTNDTNRVTFMTPGTYLRMEPYLREKYRDKKLVTIADEIHEANLEMEMATAVAASTLSDHADWRLMLSTATPDIAPMEHAYTEINQSKIPVVEVNGRPFNMEMRQDPDRTVAEVYAEVGTDHEKSLIFTSGKEEIDETIDKICKELEVRQKGSSQLVEFRKIHAGITQRERLRLEDPVPPQKRLVYVATNAAQSGITLTGVTLVLSDGGIKRQELANDGSLGLGWRLASRSELVQQAGRGGRDVDGGIFYLARPVADGAEFIGRLDKRRREHAPAEIYHRHLGRGALMMAGLNKNLRELNPLLVHSAKERQVIDAYEQLYRLGAVDGDDAITPRGKLMDKLAPRPELSRAVVEAWQGGYSMQTLAHVAIVAAAIEVGGLANFAHDAGVMWKTLLRPTTSDDIVAQLDMFQQIGPLYDGRNFPEYRLLQRDIDPKNARTAYHQYEKMLRSMGYAAHDIVVSPPNLDEEQALRDCVLAGMIDVIYQRRGTTGRTAVPVYGNILGEADPTNRALSSRSVLPKDTKGLVAGYPRWYEKIKMSSVGVRTIERRDILEMVMPINTMKLGEYVHELTSLEPQGLSLKNGVVVEKVQPTYGRIRVGGISEREPLQLTPAAEKLLIDHLYNVPPASLRELHTLTRGLDSLKQRVPAARLGDYFDDVQILTNAHVQAMLHAAVRQERSASKVDMALRAQIINKRLNRGRWISDDALATLLANSPDQIAIPNISRAITVRYHDGRPYATGIRVTDVTRLPESVALDDGREILFRLTINDKKHTITAADAKRLLGV